MSSTQVPSAPAVTTTLTPLHSCGHGQSVSASHGTKHTKFPGWSFELGRHVLADVAETVGAPLITVPSFAATKGGMPCRRGCNRLVASLGPIATL